MRTATGKLTYKGYPTLKDLVENKGMHIYGHDGKRLTLSWGKNKFNTERQIIEVKLGDTTTYIDKQDLLYALRAVPDGAESRPADWELNK